MRDTRDHIIHEAGRLFLHNGYEGVSIQDITRAVGMTKGALYHHFTSKEQLFEAVAHHLLAIHTTDFLTLPNSSLAEFYSSLAESMRARETAAEETTQLNMGDYGINIYNLLWDAVRILPSFRAFVASFNAAEHAAWKQAIQSAIDHREIRRGLDADKIARLFTSVADGIGTTFLSKGEPRQRHNEVLILWDALYQVLKR